jgi:predicted transcriptional regulator YdeE
VRVFDSKDSFNKEGQSTIECGNLWQKFEKENLSAQIPHKAGDEIYAVYFDYEGDHTKPSPISFGCKVKPDTETPQGMDSLIIPKENYAKVVSKGENAWLCRPFMERYPGLHH